MERTAKFGWYAIRFGWTYQQTVRENPAWYLDRLGDFVAIHDEVRAEKQKAGS